MRVHEVEACERASETDFLAAIEGAPSVVRSRSLSDGQGQNKDDSGSNHGLPPARIVIHRLDGGQRR
jgi:hypothetical protein